MSHLKNLLFVLLLTTWPLAGLAQSEAAAPPADERQLLADSFAQLVFGFCAILTSQNGTPKTDSIPSSLMLRGPLPLSEVGPLSAKLQERLKGTPESMVYIAVPPASEIGRFHIAYAMADGSECVALAQELPDAVAQVISRIESDPQFRLQAEGNRRVYVGSVPGAERSISVVVPKSASPSALEDVKVARREGELLTFASAEDLRSWSSAIFQKCLQSAQQKTTASVADFAGFLVERPSKAGGMSIVSPPQYPSAMLFTESGRRTGCRVLLSAGVEQNSNVVEVWREALMSLGAKRGTARNGDEELVLARVRGASNAGVRVTMKELISGVFSFVIVSD